MRKLKNYVTIFKTIKNGSNGLITYLRYLTDEQHSNHRKSGHIIVNMKSWQRVASNIIAQTEQQNIQRLLRRKKGRKSSKTGHSITLNVPHKIDSDTAKRIMNRLLWEYMKAINEHENLNMDKEQIKQHVKDFIFYNIHIQPSGSKTQFNFVMSEYINNKKLDLSKRKYSHIFKLMSNEVLKEFGFDHTFYQIKQSEKKVAKKRQTIKQYKSAHLDEQLKDVQFQKEFEIKRLKEQFESYLDSLDVKIQKRLNTYMKRIDDASKDNNREKFDKYAKLVDKALKKASMEVEMIGIKQ